MTNLPAEISEKNTKNNDSSNATKLSQEAHALFHSAASAVEKKQILPDVLDFGLASALYGSHAKPDGPVGDYIRPFDDGGGGEVPPPKPEPTVQNPGLHPFSPSEIAATGMPHDPTTSQYEQVPGSKGVEQGEYDTCWFEATVAALADTPKGRQDISNMITQNPDGSYKVTFPGDANNPVTVTAADLNNPKIQDSALWARVLEAAIVKEDPSEAENGGYSSKAFKLLTGQNPEQEAVHSSGAWWNPFDNGHDSLGDIQKGLAQGDAITVSTPDMNNPYSGPVVWSHQYQVVSADANSQTITLRNPWGENKAGDNALPGVGQTKDGITDIGGGEITMSYATFRQDFSTVDISQT